LLIEKLSYILANDFFMLTLMSKNIEIYKLNRVYNAFVPGFVIRLSLSRMYI